MAVIVAARDETMRAPMKRRFESEKLFVPTTLKVNRSTVVVER